MHLHMHLHVHVDLNMHLHMRLHMRLHMHMPMHLHCQAIKRKDTKGEPPEMYSACKSWKAQKVQKVVKGALTEIKEFI